MGLPGRGATALHVRYLLPADGRLTISLHPTSTSSVKNGPRFGDERLAHNRPWGIGYITHPVHGPYWTDRSLQPDYSRVKVPTLLWSGWADVYPTQILRAFANLEVPKKVLVGPWGHW